MLNKYRFTTYLLVISGLLLLNNCKDKDKEDETPEPVITVPVVTTTSATAITLNSATTGGNVTSDGGAAVTARGVCWGLSPSPTVADSVIQAGSGTGVFTSTLTGLSSGTTYYIRAFATNSSGTGYGSSKSFTTTQIVTDADGNIYNTITIGTQVWMVENLKTTKYRNGDPIQNVTDNPTWINLTAGAYCNYNNDNNNGITYGRLYNWYAVSDLRNLAPAGWHIPTDTEWATLVNYLGQDSTAAGALKETGLTHWASPNTGATNSSGFTALPGGERDNNGAFMYLTYIGHWWTATEAYTTQSWYRRMFSYSTTIDRNFCLKTYGYSVRCVKD